MSRRLMLGRVLSCIEARGGTCRCREAGGRVLAMPYYSILSLLVLVMNCISSGGEEAGRR